MRTTGRTQYVHRCHPLGALEGWGGVGWTVGAVDRVTPEKSPGGPGPTSGLPTHHPGYSSPHVPPTPHRPLVTDPGIHSDSLPLAVTDLPGVSTGRSTHVPTGEGWSGRRDCRELRRHRVSEPRVGGRRRSVSSTGSRHLSDILRPGCRTRLVNATGLVVGVPVYPLKWRTVHGTWVPPNPLPHTSLTAWDSGLSRRTSRV